MRPSRISRDATNRAVLLAMAKQSPCAGRIMAVLTPITSPRVVTSGPPELPGLSAASVWMTSSISRPDRARSERPSALTTPAVTVCWKPNGLPIAMASWPTRTARESPSVARQRGPRRVDADDGEVGVRIVADEVGAQRRPSGSAHVMRRGAVRRRGCW